MTLGTKEHKKRHEILHTHLDELYADFMLHHRERDSFVGLTVRELMTWSFLQKTEPTEVP